MAVPASVPNGTREIDPAEPGSRAVETARRAVTMRQDANNRARQTGAVWYW